MGLEARVDDVLAVELCEAAPGRALVSAVATLASGGALGPGSGLGNVDWWYPRQDSNLCLRLRRPTLYPLSYGGSVTHRIAAGT